MRNRCSIGRLLLYGILTVAAFFWIYPFLWMLSASFKTQNEFFASSVSLFPKSVTLENLVRAWNNANFGVYFKNSVLVTVSVVLIVLFTTALAGYVMGRYNFAGKKVVLSI